MVLNCSHNKICSIKEVEGLIELRALIANDNEIIEVCNLQKLTTLNTLVLSKNPLSDIGETLECVPSLSKLSLSDCKLQELGSIKQLKQLKELRLANNNIKYLSKDIANNFRLQIVDLGNNCFKNLSKIEVLKTLPHLKNLNVRGNPFCLQNNYQEQLKTLLPTLRILDGHPLRDFKRKALDSDATSITTEKLEDVPSRDAKGSKAITEADQARMGQTWDTSGASSDVNMLETFQKGKEEHKENFVSTSDAQGAVHHKVNKKKRKNHGISEHIFEDEGQDKKVIKENDDMKREAYDTTSDYSEDEPFMELISQHKQNKGSSKRSSTIEQRVETGVVSISQNQRKVKKRQNVSKTSSAFSIYLTEVEVGKGGPSTWD
ncbi:hypothetical protein KP509_21G058800 [Ceratopteris richardii]|nr:hypothetical protein KP509_21G058800 [Ceratopteris richardii]